MKNRRDFALRRLTIPRFGGVWAAGILWAASLSASVDERFTGLLYGAAIGDALGGPVEFQPPLAVDRSLLERPLDADGLAAWRALLELRPYERPVHPYGPWESPAPAGTITDDTRSKLILAGAGRRPGGWTRDNLAREILAWYESGPSPHYRDLSRENLEEFARAAHWVLGDEDRGYPPARLWGGVPTMAGQMFFPPVAGRHPGDPEAAYLATYRMNFLDTGMARDFTAGLVAGLAEALEPGADWAAVHAAMRETDPYAYGAVPWVGRRFTAWLDRAVELARRAEGVPSRLYALLDAELGARTHWECWVPVGVGFACAELAGYDPTATLSLVLAYGHDTDSNAQLIGAFFGALHGPDAYPASWREAVNARLIEDYGVSIENLALEILNPNF